MTDDVLQQLPSLTFQLGSSGEFDLVLSPDDYMLKSTKDGAEIRCLGIMTVKVMAGDTGAIFGNTVMLRYLTVHDRANKRIGFAESTETCGGPPDCGSYTECLECAALGDACAYDFSKKQCISAAEAGSHLLAFPICQGKSCACELGQQSFLLYGLATGFVGCSAVIALIVVLCGICSVVKGQRPPISVLPNSRSQYERGNSIEEQYGESNEWDIEGVGVRSGGTTGTSSSAGSNDGGDEFGAFQTGENQAVESRLIPGNTAQEKSLGK
jgi:Xylanase inhibitor C-terminal